MLLHLNKMNNVLTWIGSSNHIIFGFVSHATFYKILLRSLDSRNLLSRPFHLALAFTIIPYGDRLNVV